MTSDVTRRRFCELAGLSAASLLVAGQDAFAEENWNRIVREILGTDHRPGVAACRVDGTRATWLGGFGWADLENKTPMTSDSILNIASVSKTITAAAVMQLWEAGKLDLDACVNEYLPFPVRNPRVPDAIITARQLLAHRSSIKDGPSYDRSYSCGDPTISLQDWLKAYLVSGGRFFSRGQNFHQWRPGTEEPPEEPRPYSNVGFGLLAFIVERISGEEFPRYTTEKVFRPLAMKNTGWYIRDINSELHAVPYTRIGEDFEFPEEYPDPQSYLPRSAEQTAVSPGDFFPHCLYSFPNYSDGLVRSSVSDLSRFLIAMMNGGRLGDRRILEKNSIETMLSDDHFGRGLCWSSTTLGGKSERIWYHGGSDPGVMTFLGFRPHDRVGVIALSNCGDPGPGFPEIVRTLFLGAG
jgi:CubicO group peptidase (beta-lactamase class C family)